MLLTAFVFLIILSVLVLIHELGHFLVAKRLGIKVEEFGFGFPPRAFSIKRGETVYSINWLPIGGFVKLYGEDEAGGGRIQNSKFKIQNSDTKRAFFSRPPWQRALVTIAGVVMNFALAVAIISYMFTTVGVSVPGNNVVVIQVVKGSPAELVGLKPQDTVISINNTKITQSQELIDITKKNLGKQLTLIVKNKEGKTRNVTVVPRIDYPKTEGPMGIAIGQSVEVKKYPWYKAPFLGTVEALKLSWLTLSELGSSLLQFGTTGEAPKGIAGPVGIAQLTGQFVKIGPSAVLWLMALLSLNLAVLNILPIPALDGGRLLFIAIEVVTRRKVSPRIEGYIHTVGMMILLTLIALITMHDLTRLFSGKSLLPE